MSGHHLFFHRCDIITADAPSQVMEPVPASGNEGEEGFVSRQAGSWHQFQHGCLCVGAISALYSPGLPLPFLHASPKARLDPKPNLQFSKIKNTMAILTISVTNFAKFSENNAVTITMSTQILTMQLLAN